MGGRLRMDAECDRLSGLQDDLLLKIMSFVGLKDAIGTSVLSPRWRYLWTFIPHLSFSTKDFSTMDDFSNVVTHVLSHRTHLSSVSLHVRGDDAQDVSQRIMNHAFFLNAQQVNVKCLSRKKVGLSLSISGSQHLKHFTLSSDSFCDPITLTPKQELLSLTTLCLDHITLCDGFFSKVPNLENLTLACCDMMEPQVLRICHPRLSFLTIKDNKYYTSIINVTTPQLKNLTISRHYGRFHISAPELASLFFEGRAPFMFSTEDFHSLEKVQLSIHTLRSYHAPVIISLLQKFQNVKLLSLSVEIIQILNSSVELILHQPSPLANLKSLKILPRIYCYLRHKHTRVIMCGEVKKYLLNSSPKATLTEVLGEHCCDLAAARLSGYGFASCLRLMR